jgi:hypothetical protein
MHPSEELRKAAEEAEKENDWSRAADLYLQALEVMPKARTMRHRSERLRLKQRQNFCRLKVETQKHTQKTTAQLSEEARQAAEQLQWQAAADLYRQALEAFPAFLVGEMYDRHRAQLADKVARYQKQADMEE